MNTLDMIVRMFEKKLGSLMAEREMMSSAQVRIYFELEDLHSQKQNLRFQIRNIKDSKFMSGPLSRLSSDGRNIIEDKFGWSYSKLSRHVRDNQRILTSKVRRELDKVRKNIARTKSKLKYVDKKYNELCCIVRCIQNDLNLFIPKNLIK